MSKKEEQAKLVEMGATELQVTPEIVDSMIKDTDFVLQPCKTVMVCTIKLHNGFRLFGYNTCLDTSKFDLKQAEERSFNEARNQVFSYAAYQLLEDHFRGNAPLSQEQRELPDHIQRVIRELFQTSSRMIGLEQFVSAWDEMPEADRPKDVSLEEIEDLREQLGHMVKYTAVLQRRLARAGLK
jgi:hypothetical protein